MKKIISLLFMIFLIWSPLQAQNIDGVLTVGLMDNIPPISYMDEYDQPSGIFSDVIIEIAKKENWEIEFIHETFPVLLEMTKNNEIDLMVGLINTEERQEFLHFNNNPVMTSWTQAFVHPETVDIENILDLEDKVIGLMESDQNGLNFIEIASSFNIQYSVMYYPNYELLEQGILNKEVDAGMFFSLYALTKDTVKPSNILFTPSDSWYAVNKEREDLYFILDKIDSELRMWRSDPDSIYYDWIDKYFETLEHKVVPKWLYYAILGFALLVFLLFIWSRFLKKRIRKQTRQIYEKDNRFKQLYETMNQGVIYFDTTGNIIDMNQSAERLFGVKKKDIIGNNVQDVDITVIYEDGSHSLPNDFMIEESIRENTIKMCVMGIFNSIENKIIWLNAVTIPEVIDDKINRVYATFDDITDLKLALDTIEEREKETNKIIENMSAGFAYHKMFYDNEGRAVDYEYIKTNGEFHKLVEMPHDIVGKKVSQVFPNIKVEEWIDDYANVAETQKPNRIEKYVESMGKWFDISVYSPKEGYFATIFNDITDRKNNEQILKASEDALRENQKRLSTTFESIGDGVIAVDTNFKVTMMNKIAKNILHWDSGYYGTDLDQILNLKDINIGGKSIKDIAKKVFESKQPYYINQASLHIESTDEIKIIEDSVSPIYNGDTMYGLVIVFRDITEKIQAQKKTEELENQLNQSQKMESVGQFAGGIAHNFNNIITAINGYVSIIESESKNAFDYSNELNEIKLSANRASDLTSQLLTVSRRQSTNPNIIDPNNVLISLTSMMKTLAGENIQIEDNFNSSHKIKADQNQIEQIVLNFVANSKDALNIDPTRKDKRIEIGTEDFYVSQEYSDQYLGVEQGEYVIISFADNGPGIPDDIKDKIFDPFFTTKEKGKGTGLGLSTVYGIVKQNGAAIHLYSEPDKGTVFKIFWPTTFEETKVKQVKSIAPKKIHGKERILFVEDEYSLQDLADQFLTKLGYEVTIAENGEEGLLELNGNADTIDIVVTDVVMPKMSGPELYNKMKELNPDLKVLFTSGYTKDHVIGDIPIAENEEIEFISKPYSLKALAEKIREILDN